MNRNKRHKKTSDIEQDLERVARQEERLRFPGFDADTAWTVGARIRALAESRGLSVAIDIQVNGHQLFFTAMPGTTPDNIDWIRRKRSVVQHFHRSSYAIGLELRRQQTSLAETIGVDARDYAPHGGCFPIKLRGTGCIGTITVSGLPQRADHELIIEVLAELLEQSLKELALEAHPNKPK
jgi:uncharacterized protein (UPF0303 family)